MGKAFVSANAGWAGVKELALRRFTTMMPVKFETATDDPWLNGVLIEAGADGRATSIEQILLSV